MLNPNVVRDLKKSGWSNEVIDALEPYYVATLTHMGRGHATPVYDVIDTMWHSHILCTRDYAAFCAERFGRFVHHDRCEGAPSYEVPATDFLLEYGLSRGELAAICATAGLADAGPDNHHSHSERTCANGAHLGVARCADGPAPPGLAIARCGDGPVPPGLAIARCSDNPPDIAIARCGEGPVPPGLAIARCGDPAPEPPGVQAAS